mmetsp:Transcript_78839/g.231371  ORF Transcript_78839/g.231371 Transcript_78839/m.231371 type:complete len:213 (+) Transcript_78839:1332-1970(+)
MWRATGIYKANFQRHAQACSRRIKTEGPEKFRRATLLIGEAVVVETHGLALPSRKAAKHWLGRLAPTFTPAFHGPLLKLLACPLSPRSLGLGCAAAKKALSEARGASFDWDEDCLQRVAAATDAFEGETLPWPQRTRSLPQQRKSGGVRTTWRTVPRLSGPGGKGDHGPHPPRIAPAEALASSQVQRGFQLQAHRSGETRVLTVQDTRLGMH